MAESKDWLSVGKIVGVQGLQGELRVNPASDFPERFTAPGPRWLRSCEGGEATEIQLKKGRQLPGKSIFVVQFEGVESRNAAAALVGHELLVPANDRPELKDGEFHLLDLLGLEARMATTGVPIGSVIDLLSYGQDLLKIKGINGKIYLIPLVKEIVPDIKIEHGYLLLNPPPGLLDLA